MTLFSKKACLKDEVENKKYTGVERNRGHNAPDPGTQRRGTESNQDGC